VADEGSRDNLNEHLSRISTQWSVLFDANRGTASPAQEKLLRRYSGAVYRYLYAVLRDTHAADELAQEFALNFLRGGFRGASPDRGRFRDYVKASLFNLIRGHHRQRLRQTPRSDVADDELTTEDVLAEDQRFLEGWRDELLARVWEALLLYENDTGRPFHTLLKYRVRNPDTSSAKMAAELGQQLGQKLTAAGVRQTLHRAREAFGDLLVEEAARSLETTDRDAIAQELIDLGLHAYCKDAIDRWRGAGRDGGGE
jgi:RNA polymerase sigma-70 factor (ECF subfamily)